VSSPNTKGEWPNFTLVDFFTESALLSLLEVLAALGELRPLERMSSLIGEALPSGLAGCFLRPLRSVDIYLFNRNKSTSKSAFVPPLYIFLSYSRSMDGAPLLRARKMKNQEHLPLLQFFLGSSSGLKGREMLNLSTQKHSVLIILFSNVC